MYDMHYDLLTSIYFNNISNNKKGDLKKFIQNCKEVYKPNNITGGIVNLYFMSEEEMKEELGIEKEDLYNVPAMFKKSIELLEDLKNQSIIYKDIDFIYSIEGCDYIKDENELEQLYNMGLRAILPVWNNKNKYGSGIRSEIGLTKEGINLIKKAISLGIIIDISHANLKTFDDIIKVIKETKEKEPILIASHSNCRSLCDRPRNLTDEQLIKLKNANGYIGLFSNSRFTGINNDKKNKIERQNEYLKHLKHVLYDIGFNKEKILLSTDDMNFDPDESYHESQSFDLKNLRLEMRSFLENSFDDENINNFMFNNAKRIFKKVQ